MASFALPVKIGAVIRILDKFRLIVDAGKGQLSIGDKIQVYAPDDGEIILDLDKKPLAHYVHIKDELVVIQVEDNFSICEKQKPLSTYSATSQLALSPLLGRGLKPREPLNVNEEEICPLENFDKKIHVGDPIKKH